MKKTFFKVFESIEDKSAEVRHRTQSLFRNLFKTLNSTGEIASMFQNKINFENALYRIINKNSYFT